jgi:hypothetical protein
MSHFSPDPEIRLRQKYESNRPFEDSLFLEVDKISCGSTEGRAGIDRIMPLDGSAILGVRESYPANSPLAVSTQASPAGIEVQADGFHPESGSARARVGLTTNKHSEYAHVSEGSSRNAGAAYQERGIGQPEQVSASSEGRQAGGALVRSVCFCQFVGGFHQKRPR